ncbi:hypothetical protein ACQ4PT_013597 [Festuca glaucescens]
MASGECRGMDSEECRQVLLTRVQRVNPWDAEEIVHHIFNVLTLQKIRPYVDASDARINTLIGKMEKTMRPRAPSPGREFPPPSWNSWGQSSENFEGIQAPPAGQSGTSQLPGSSTVPDDGMLDFPDPSWGSQGQSSSTSVGVQAAHSGQIVTSQIPDDKSIGLKENSQAPSVPVCSNAFECLPTSSRPWTKPCRYISNGGVCMYGSWCRFSHGFESFRKFEMEIRQLLLLGNGYPLRLAELPWIYLVCYRKHLQEGWNRTPDSLERLLQRVHNVCLLPDSDGELYIVLLEDAPFFLGFSVDNLNMMDPHSGAHQIYITFSPESREICTETNVYSYFRQYGPVLSVNIPHRSSFGFVRFQCPETVRLLLSEWNSQVPHFICGARVRIDRCIPKGEAKLNSAGKHGLENGCGPEIVTEKSSGTSAPDIAPPLTHSQPSHSQMEICPLEGGDVTGSPDGDSADHSQPSHSQVEIDSPEGGDVTGSPDGDSADHSQPSHSHVEIDPPEGIHMKFP